jgi:dTMP kinase
MKGTFITLEGIDGCGKTTIMTFVEDHLSRSQLPFVLTREPGGTSIGESIRKIILETANRQMTALTELLLYAADRAQHVQEKIWPALAEGKLVISDRYADATLAYQGHGRGNDLQIVSQLIEIATGGLKPDLTIILDLEVEAAQKRLRARRATATTDLAFDRLDQETLEFHERVRQAYHEMARREPDRFRMIDASGSPEDTARFVIAAIQAALEAWQTE